MNLLFKLFLIVNITFFILHPAYSQKISTPLDPRVEPLGKDVGIIFGIGDNFQSGEFRVNCQECLFDNANGLGFTLGALYQQEFTRDLWFGFMALYEGTTMQASFKEKELLEFTLQNSTETEMVPVLFRHTADTKFGYLTGIPYIMWTPTDFFFVRLGLSASFVLDAKIKHTQEALDKIVFLSNGDTAYVHFGPGRGNSVVVEDGDFPEIKSFQLGLSPSVGFNLKLSEIFHLAPSFQYTIPLGILSDKGNGFKVNYWRLLLELRLSLETDKYRKRK